MNAIIKAISNRAWLVVLGVAVIVVGIVSPAAVLHGLKTMDLNDVEL